MDFLKQIADKKGKIDFLIVGDSIGDGSSADSTETKWASLLRARLQEKYGCEVTVTNVAVGGTESLFGYHTLMRFSDRLKFDAVFVCHGQNDNETVFPTTYEVLLRGVRRKYPDAYISCFLESSQRDYTPKIKTIIRLAEKYGCTLIDTIKAFADSGISYDELSADGVHVNNKGAAIYAETAFKALTENLKPVSALPDEVDNKVLSYDYYRFVPKYEMQYALANYRIKTKAEHISVDCIEAPNAEGYSVFVNGEKVFENSFKHPFTYVWERVHPVDSPDGEKEIRITLEDETDVNLLSGIILMGSTKESIALKGDEGV
ncbi:MAG: SGNH/GDSL hydrolase family protein [Clostridia bacterium]|nr:SGNH/GDSL hydrolase family protein [Clostridia bacterium]